MKFAHCAKCFMQTPPRRSSPAYRSTVFAIDNREVSSPPLLRLLHESDIRALAQVGKGVGQGQCRVDGSWLADPLSAWLAAVAENRNHQDDCDDDGHKGRYPVISRFGAHEIGRVHY